MTKKDTIELARLRIKFLYDLNGKPNLNDYGVFKIGLTEEEVENYLKVRANSLKVPEKIRKRYEESNRGDTCPCVYVDEKMIGLFYRWDVKRHADYAFDGKQTYFD